MAIELHVWTKAGSTARSWGQIIRPILTDICHQKDIIIARASLHIRPKQLHGKETEKLIKIISEKTIINQFHILILTNCDVICETVNGQKRVSLCLADKIMLMNSISRLNKNSRIIILDLINPLTAPSMQYDLVKQEIIHASTITRSRVDIADFTWLNSYNVDHCLDSNTRHMCSDCVNFTEKHLTNTLESLKTSVQICEAEE